MLVTTAGCGLPADVHRHPWVDAFRGSHERIVGGNWCRPTRVRVAHWQMVCRGLPLRDSATMTSAMYRTRRSGGVQATAAAVAVCVGLVVLLAMPDTASAQCSNACSGHGTCNSFSTCTCFTGWREGDCSLRTCPSGLPWVGKGSDYTLHVNTTECSNNGVCNRRTGRCKCNDGFTGAACDRRE